MRNSVMRHCAFQLSILSFVLICLGSMPVQAESITVYLLPLEANDEFGFWKIGDGDWNASGATVSVTPGTYTINFGIYDVLTFSSFDVTVGAGQDVVRVAMGSGPSGQMRVTLSPAGAVSAGARWSPNYGQNYYTSGASVALAEGTYPVSFTGVSGFTTPTTFNAKVNQGATTALQASYAGNTGALTVQIASESLGDSASATNDGAQWRLSNENIWRDSGDSIGSLDAGNYTVLFKEVNGWKAPSSISITVVEGQSITRTGTYIRDVVTLKGVVVDEFGTGLDGTAVSLTYPGGSRSVVLQPADFGSWQFTGLPTNTSYTVSVLRQKYQFDKDQQTVAVGNTGGTFTFAVFRGLYSPTNLSINGTVFSPGGGGIEGITLLLDNAISAVTDAQGRYTFGNLSKGTYSISMQPNAMYETPTESRNVRVPRNTSVDLVDWIIRRNDLKISGLLTGLGGAPLAGTEVRLQGEGQTVTVTTDAQGQYTFAGLISGTYDITPLGSATGYIPETRRMHIFDSNIDTVNFQEIPQSISELEIAGLRVYAITITETGENRYETSNPVWLGANSQVRLDTTTEIDADEETISGVGRIVLTYVPGYGDITIYDGVFTIEDGEIPVPNLEIQLDFGFMELTIDEVILKNRSVSLVATIGLDFLVRTVEISAGVNLTSSGFELESFSTSISQIPVGPWELLDTSVFYEKEDNAFGGETTLSTPIIDIEARLAMYQGLLDSIGFGFSREVPIYPPFFYLTRIYGAVSNMANQEPIQIEAEADFDIGKKLGDLRMVTVEGRIVVVLSGSFSVAGDVSILGINAGSGEISYNHNPNRHFRAAAAFNLGSFPRIEINGEVNLAFQPFNVWGSASALIVVEVRIDFFFFTANVRFNLAGAGASFTKDSIRAWAEILGARLEGLIDGEGFRITRPGWLTWVRVSFDVDTGEPRLQIDDGAMVNAANNLSIYDMPAGLGEAHFFMAWEKGSSNPSLVSPSGVVFDGSENGFTYTSGIDTENRIAWYRVFVPEAGLWSLEYSNSGNIGETYGEITEYPFAPGVAISAIETLGTNLYRIHMLRSNLATEQVELFFEPADREGDRIVLAGPDQIGQALTYDWDASTAAPGVYSLYARVYDDENHPFLFQYDQLIRVEGDNSERIAGKPKVRKSRNSVKIIWNKLDDPEISYYRLYYTDDLKADGFSAFVDIEAGKNRVELDADILKPGRRYRVAVTPVFEDGSEGPLSSKKTFTFRAKDENNIPQFTSSPKERVKLGRTFTYTAKARDRDRDTLYYRLVAAPEGMNIQSATGEVSWDTTDVLPGVQTVAIQVSDGTDIEVQRFNLLVFDTTAQGSIQIRPVYDAQGRKAYIVSYWNPFLNLRKGAVEKLPATLRTAASPAGIPINLREAGKDYGYFSAVIQEAKVEKAIQAARTSVGPAALGLDSLIIELEGKHRKEKVSVKR